MLLKSIYLQRIQNLKDIKNVYKLFSSLLDDTNKEYIRIFACEAFAALLRKVRSREDLFTFIFCDLQQNPKQTYGVGQLFFETVKGVKEQFHYCIEPVFKLLLRFLGKENLSTDLIEESLHQMLISMAKHTVQRHCVQVQEIFSAVFNELIVDIQETDIANEDKIRHLNRVLHLLCFWIRFKNGKLITSENGLINVILNLSGLKSLPQYCLISVVEVISSVMMNGCLNLPIEKLKVIISQICSHSDESAVLFTRSTLKYGMFEKDILPVFLSICLKMIQSEDDEKRNKVLEILSEAIMTLKPFTESEDDIKSFSKLYLHINSSESSSNKDEQSASYGVFEHFFMEYLQYSDMESNLMKTKSALICLPHLRFLKKDNICHVIEELSQKIHQTLLAVEITNSEKSRKLRSVLYQAYFAYLVITVSDKRNDTIFNTRFFMDLLMKFPGCVDILRMVDYYISNLTKAPVIEDLPELISTIIPNLASPFHLVRLFTLRILKSFDLQEQQGKNKVSSVFSICFEAENISLDVQTYREKLKWLRKLEYEFIEKNLPPSYAEPITKAAIHYLLGMLYVNFKLLWDPSINILQTYANAAPQLFWDIFYPHLEKSFEQCVRFNSGEDVYPVSESSSNEKVDIFNHHTLLWKAMEGFHDLVERKNKVLVPMLLQFMVKLVEPPEPFKEEDSELIDDNVEKDLSQLEEKDDSINEDSDNESEDEGKLDRPKVLKSKKKKPGVRKFQISKVLAAYLNIFSKFKNPKGGYKADELQKLYKELLSNTDPKIQKLAFDCVMTFGYKYLTPYKENFYRILDNKTFKTEVVLFSVDTENKVIAEEHRMDALAILMRILYGKMLYKIDSRPMVLRFLAGCTAEELKMFFELVFLPFKEQMKDDSLTAVKKIKENADVTAIVPIRKQHSALNTLGLIFQNLGNLIPELLPSLLKVLLIITATSSTLLTKRDEVLPHCLNLLKSVRTQAVVKLIQFFKTFEDYKYLPEEIDAIFESIIWTMLPRLELDSVNQPSPLLRLFATWSENIRYFILFAKHAENDKSLTPLHHMMELYCSSRCKPRVIGVLSKIVYQLLCAEDKISEETESEKISPIEINCSVTLPEIEIDNVPCTLGTKLLFPYVDKILCRFEMIATALSKRKIKKSLPIRDLTILLRITRFVEDPKLCFKLIQLLLPFLMKPKLDTDSEVLILNTISSLLRKSENPDYFIKLLAPFFGKLSNQNSRTALVGVFSTISEIRPEMKQLTSIVSKINAYDLSFIGQPDYQLRSDGNKETLEIVKKMDKTSINEDFIRIIIFNSSHMIRTCDDLSLRISFSNVLQELSKFLHTNINSSPELIKLLILDTLLQEVQKGIKSPSESVRHEFIQVLQVVLEVWKGLPALKELVALCHEDKDMDFWENIRHIQVHRRSRALLRFADLIRKQCENKETISIYYLTSYMIPIVSSFLFNSAYNKHVHVIDAAIETLSSIALALPWHQYEPLLKQYLQMLSTDIEHQKTIIKIIVALLNSFHFETSSKRPAPVSEDPVIKKPALELTNAESMETEGEAEGAEMPIQSISVDISNDVVGVSDESFKIFISIKRNILPLLHRSLMRKTKSEDEHKWAGKHYSEDEYILRVPIALAMVKLLQKLPTESLEKNLLGIFLKMCDLLKTKAESIRETTRETLVKMMDSLGPKYFRSLLTEMIGVMKRGYQVHVMIFTINAILHKLTEKMGPGDLDSSAADLTRICANELFSDIAEEKEVEKITGKLKEARSIKSYSIFKILSQFVSEEHLLEIIQPLKEEVTKRHSHKIMKKVSECLKSIAQGLSKNQGVEDKKLLVFIHLIINESMPGLNKKKQEDATKPKFERPDCLLIPKEPGRSGPPAKLNKKTSDHVFVEFGLQLLLFSLKKDTFDKNKKEILEMLDPFVALLADCLASNNVKIITLALQCLKPLYKYPLPSFKTITRKIVNSLFLIVNKYAAVGMAQGENFEMVVMCFKLLTVLVKDSQYHVMNEEQLKSLLSYVEQDMYDYLRQATAFTLLKAILSKKLQAPELRGILSKVAEMSITSEQAHVRNQCRQVCMQYMLDYPLGKHLEKSITFFISQLEYPMEHGRVSALEMINSMLNSFPENVLKRHSALFLIPLSARLVNDVPECRKMVAQCIKTLLTKIQHDGRSSIFSVPFAWLQAKKVSMKRLGAQLCGMFAEIEGELFENILLFHDELYQLLQEYVKSQADERSTDHFLYQILNSLTKMLSFCPVIRKKDFADSLKSLYDELQGLILYPHVWVRFATNQLFNLMLLSYSVEEIVKAICKKKKDNSVFLNSRQMLRDLSADFSTQLQSPFLDEKFGELIIRNLIYLARIIAKLPEKSVQSEETVQVTLDWMIRRLCREAKREVADNPTFYERRRCVFMFMAAFAGVIEKEKLVSLLSNMLVPLCREISDASKYTNEDIKKIAQEALDIIKTIVGVDEFSDAYAQVQTTLFKKKVKRKQEKAQEAVTDPEKYAQKRIKKQLSKRESKKRKIMKLKGKKKVVKKTKLSDLVIAS
ncbi:Small subunit processome component 20 like protein [Argiope bruennichi]|uniref:Small subunit processome component 20 like protein n=1 Tax=Argiope bruennichi TaxID=94029 RepID=A0A8T0EBU1_ARGBR|nr:Small subunit processome component 20 like protein [Argiope bruennichi]